MMCAALPSLQCSNVSQADGFALQLLTRYAYNEIGSSFSVVYNQNKEVSDSPLKPLVGSSNKGSLIKRWTRRSTRYV